MRNFRNELRVGADIEFAPVICEEVGQRADLDRLCRILCGLTAR